MHNPPGTYKDCIECRKNMLLAMAMLLPFLRSQVKNNRNKRTGCVDKGGVMNCGTTNKQLYLFVSFCSSKDKQCIIDTDECHKSPYLRSVLPTGAHIAPNME